MTLSSQKLYYVGNIFLLILFPSCELSGHSLLHCICLDSVYQYRRETIISKFTRISKSPWNTETAHCVRTQKLLIWHSYYKTIPYSYFYLLRTLHKPIPKLFLLCYIPHKNYHAKEYGHYFREFMDEFKAKRVGKRRKTKHNVIIKPQVSGFYN